MIFSDSELDYLKSQKLGRLATVDAGGGVQNNPVGFHVNSDGTVDIRGHDLTRTRKFRNVRDTGRVALVVDDLASINPWHVRGVEIRGRAEALEHEQPPSGHWSTAVIRVHPERIIVWGGINPGTPGIRGRDVAEPVHRALQR